MGARSAKDLIFATYLATDMFFSFTIDLFSGETRIHVDEIYDGPVWFPRA